MKRTHQQQKSWFVWLDRIATVAGWQGVTINDAIRTLNERKIDAALTSNFLHETISKGILMPLIDPKAQSTSDLSKADFARLQEAVERACAAMGVADIPDFPSTDFDNPE